MTNLNQTIARKEGEIAAIKTRFTEMFGVEPDGPATTEPVTSTTPTHSRGSRHPGLVDRVAAGTSAGRGFRDT